jgi:AcrR family transcriptional regulator
MVSPSSKIPAKPVGLRERKKQKTRWAIQTQALRLIAQQGYEATTVDQIAAAAEISPSTFFRYFRTKEDVIIEDEYDPLIVEAIERVPDGLTPIGVIRHGLHDVFTRIDDDNMDKILTRFHLVFEVPALRAKVLEGIDAGAHMLAEAVGRRLGCQAMDFELLVLAYSVVGALMVALETWLAGGEQADPVVLVDRALAALDSGFAPLASVWRRTTRPRPPDSVWRRTTRPRPPDSVWRRTTRPRPPDGTWRPAQRVRRSSASTMV